MQPTWLEDEEGYPRTASAGYGLIVLIVAVTVSTAAFLLQLYLCLWIFKKTRSTRSLISFCVMMFCIVADVALQGIVPKFATITLDLSVGVSYVTAALLLRSDVQNFFRKTQGWEPVINPMITCLLSAIYINKCLTPDTAVASPLTTLNIQSATASAKIEP